MKFTVYTPHFKAVRLTSYIKLTTSYIKLTGSLLNTNKSHHITAITGACQEIAELFARVLHL